MPDENTQDNGEQVNTEEMPSLEHVLDHWITVKEASEIMRLKEQSVSRLCKEGVLRAKKVGRQWYIDPYSAHAHKKGQHRRSN